MRDPKKIIISHIVTEKYSQLREAQNCYVFEVDINANKIEVKEAVEKLFDVKVDSVKTMRMRGKMKRLGRFLGKRPNWKKAVVNLVSGETISQLDAV